MIRLFLGLFFSHSGLIEVFQSFATIIFGMEKKVLNSILADLSCKNVAVGLALTPKHFAAVL